MILLTGFLFSFAASDPKGIPVLKFLGFRFEVPSLRTNLHVSRYSEHC